MFFLVSEGIESLKVLMKQYKGVLLILMRLGRIVRIDGSNKERIFNAVVLVLITR